MKYAAALIASLGSTMLVPLNASAAEIYGGYGAVTGLNLGLSLRLSTNIGVRVEGHTFTLDRRLDVDGNPFDLNLTFRGGGAYADLHPFGGAFRLVLGAAGGTHQFGGTAQIVNNTVEIGDRTFTVRPGEQVSLTARFPSVMPYLGIGWGLRGDKPGVRFHSDLGFMVGKPQARIGVSNSLLTNGGVTPADIRREEQKAQAELDKFRVLPVFKAGIGYTF